MHEGVEVVCLFSFIMGCEERVLRESYTFRQCLSLGNKYKQSNA